MNGALEASPKVNTIIKIVSRVITKYEKMLIWDRVLVPHINFSVRHTVVPTFSTELLCFRFILVRQLPYQLYLH